jgi:serine/threonine protein kinase
LLHYFGFAHRDIKPENYIQVGNQWKLCDFGLAKAHKDPFKTKNVGSICFTAPEVLDDGESYSEKVDIWSLGCVFYEIIEGKELFSGICY